MHLQLLVCMLIREWEIARRDTNQCYRNQAPSLRHGLGQGPVQQGGLDQGGWLRSPASNMGDDGSTQRGWYFLDGSQGRGGGGHQRNGTPERSEEVTKRQQTWFAQSKGPDCSPILGCSELIIWRPCRSDGQWSHERQEGFLRRGTTHGLLPARRGPGAAQQAPESRHPG